MFFLRSAELIFLTRRQHFAKKGNLNILLIIGKSKELGLKYESKPCKFYLSSLYGCFFISCKISISKTFSPVLYYKWAGMSKSLILSQLDAALLIANLCYLHPNVSTVDNSIRLEWINVGQTCNIDIFKTGEVANKCNSFPKTLLSSACMICAESLWRSYGRFVSGFWTNYCYVRPS